MSNGLQKRKWSPWITVSKPVNFFRICWTIIEKSWPKHDPKWTYLCNLMPTESSQWRHFRWKVKTTEDYALLNFEASSIRPSNFRKNKKSAICVDDGRPTRAPFLVTQERMMPMNHSFQNCKLFKIRLNCYRETTTRKWPKMKTFMLFAANQK